MKALQFRIPLAVILVSLGLMACSRGVRTSRGPVSLSQVWATDSVLRTPESVLYDAKRNVLYVSNINKVNKTGKDGDGFISRLTPEGQIRDLYWTTGLNDPKGLGIHNDVLYVADLTEIVAISAQTGAVLGRHTVEGARMFNDITVDSSGTVYASDSDGQKIYQLSNGRLNVWMDQAEGHRPNGLWIEPDRMLSAWADAGQVKTIDLDKKKYKDWVEGVPSTDGIVSAGSNDYFLSNWNGEVYYVNPKGKLWRVLDTKDQKISSADIDFSVNTQRLYIPTFYNNRVVAYQVRRR